MRRIRARLFLCALAVAVALVTLIPLAAAGAPPGPPFGTNVDCLGCHDLATGIEGVSKVDFGAAPVSYSRCLNCHHPPYHWKHYPNAQCSSPSCHPTSGWPARTAEQLVWYSDTYIEGSGYFSSASSLYRSPADLHRIHVNGSWPQIVELAVPYCDSCHAPAACSACHGTSPNHGPHAESEYPAVTYQQCVGVDKMATEDASFVAASTCVNPDCHNRATPTTFTPVCGDCHETNVGMHGYEAIDHAADVTDTVDPMGGTCGSCHSMDVLAEHEKPSSSPAGGGCDTCHSTPRDSFETWGQGCEQGGCHATGSPQEKHLNAASGHTPAAGNEICFECHEGTDLPTLHSTATTTTPSGTYSDCNVCHRPDATVLGTDCAVCHFTFEEHYGAERHTSTWTLDGCAAPGCHTTRDLMGVHAEQNPAFECGGCHESELPEVAEAIDLGHTACDACHAGVTQTEGHRAVHWAMPLLQDADGPHYSYWTGSAGTLPTGDCAGCHVSNLVDEHMGVYDAETGNAIRLPRRDDTGQALSCPTCHESLDLNVLDAILTGETNCDACHAVHGPVNEIHDSTFVEYPEYDCALCHDTDIADEHDGAWSVETPSGQTLVGCDVCHAYYEGDRGSEVQNAISVANDTRCSACHATYHSDAGVSHSAETTPSVEGCGVCHDDDPGVWEMDVTAIHADAAAGSCAVCHANPTRVPDIALETAECASCHTSEGTDYHLDMGVHVSPDAALCSGQCHHQDPDVTAVHPACTTCHTVVNTEGITSACTNCHLVQGVDYHVDYDVRHVPTDGASQDCARCHESTTDVRVIHATNECGTCHTGACADCHVSHGGMGGGYLLRGTQCSSCHDVVGTNYHTGMDAAHTFAAMDPSCTGIGCHAANTLPEAHEAYLSRYSAYSDTCALCHLNTGDTRAANGYPPIDWNTATADCSTCHDIHGDIAVIHTAPASQACVDCHETADVRDIHGASPAESCVFCHNDTVTLPTDTACGNTGCHAGYVPPDPNHYPVAQHAATEPVECDTCHYTDMKAEHFKDSAGPVTCVQCHELKVDFFPTPWDETCEACHATKHAEAHADHTSPNTTCTEAGCHATDLTYVHAGLPDVGCPACHNRDSLPASADCEYCHSTYHVNKDVTHTATTPASENCGRCHDEDAAAGVNVEPVHAAAVEGQCAVCHNNPARVPDITLETAECASCHAIAGTEYHRNAGTAHFYVDGASCVGAGCHASQSLPEAHEPYLSRYPQYADTCALCHLNDDPGRIDWTTAAADCSTCHTVHGDIDAIHQAPDSQACVDCHETADVRDIHPACDTCHNATVDTSGTTACGNTGCHSGYVPPDPYHYPAAQHAATTETGCVNCHYTDMKAEHFKDSSGPVSCVQCHELKVDDFTASWDKSCDACHATKHSGQASKHAPSTTGCSGTDCHDVASVETVHAGGPGGGCAYCHANPDTIPATTDCTVCHEGVGTDHHEQHNAAAYNPSGCSGCHFMYLDDEHSALGHTCDTCHESSSEIVQGAIDAGDRKCLTCHPDSAHNARQADEFNAGNASMHRVSPDLPGMRSSFVVNGTTYNWSLPSASMTFKSGWTYDSMVTCENCHTYSGATGPHGAAMNVNIDPAYPRPYDEAFLFESSSNGGFTQDVICAKCHVLASGHDWGNYVHDKHARTSNSDTRPSTSRQGNGCTTCHVSIPHGWGRPRMIGYRTDPAPYATSMYGITGLRLRSYSSITSENGWDESDCGGSGGGCEKHGSSISSVWPNVMGGGTPPPPPPPAPTTGTLTGTVTDASTSAGVSGATVSLSNGASTTTGSNGGYTLSNVAAGTYTMTVTKTGYEDWSGSVNVLAGVVSTRDVALTPTPSGGDNIALGKSFSASRYESWSYSASKAGDGDTSTFWWSDNYGDYDDREWLQVDLESTYSVERVEILWQGDYWAREYRIYTSRDNRNWSTAYETGSGSSGTNTITLSPSDARYVRVECRRTGTGRDNGYGIAELRVFGTAASGSYGTYSYWGR